MLPLFDVIQAFIINSLALPITPYLRRLSLADYIPRPDVPPQLRVDHKMPTDDEQQSK